MDAIPKSYRERATLIEALVNMKASEVPEQVRTADSFINENSATTIGRLGRNVGFGIPELLLEQTGIMPPEERLLADEQQDEFYPYRAMAAEGLADVADFAIPGGAVLRGGKLASNLARTGKGLKSTTRPQKARRSQQRLNQDTLREKIALELKDPSPKPFTSQELNRIRKRLWNFANKSKPQSITKFDSVREEGRRKMHDALMSARWRDFDKAAQRDAVVELLRKQARSATGKRAEFTKRHMVGDRRGAARLQVRGENGKFLNGFKK